MFSDFLISLLSPLLGWGPRVVDLFLIFLSLTDIFHSVTFFLFSNFFLYPILLLGGHFEPFWTLLRYFWDGIQKVFLGVYFCMDEFSFVRFFLFFCLFDIFAFGGQFWSFWALSDYFRCWVVILRLFGLYWANFAGWGRARKVFFGCTYRDWYRLMSFIV